MPFIVNSVLSRWHRLRCAVITGARLMAQEVAVLRGGFRVVPWMVTLTYRPGDEWEPGHITATMKAAREWFRRRGVPWRCIWVAELQKRGAVHYHCLIWLPARFRMPKWDNKGWWSHGMTQTERARNAVGYLAKYVSKGTEAGSGRFPKGIRTHAVSGLAREGRAIAAWWKLPGWVRDSFGMHEVKRVSGAILWYGRRLISPYRVVVEKLVGVQVVTVVKVHQTFGVARSPSSPLVDKVVGETGEIRRTSADVMSWGVKDEWKYRVCEGAWSLRAWFGGASFPDRLKFWESCGAGEWRGVGSAVRRAGDFGFYVGTGNGAAV